MWRGGRNIRAIEENANASEHKKSFFSLCAQFQETTNRFTLRKYHNYSSNIIYLAHEINHGQSFQKETTVLKEIYRTN